MATSEGKRDSSSRVQIIVALVGLAGVVATALISNWNSLFRESAPTQTITDSSSTKHAPKKTETPVRSSGQMVVRGSYHYDLDIGSQVSGSDGSDFWWDLETPVTRYLTPENGAVFYVVGATDFDALRLVELEHLPYSAERIEGSDAQDNILRKGTVVAYRTEQGRLGKFLVDVYGHNLTIQWTTYEK